MKCLLTSTKTNHLILYTNQYTTTNFLYKYYRLSNIKLFSNCLFKRCHVHIVIYFKIKCIIQFQHTDFTFLIIIYKFILLKIKNVNYLINQLNILKTLGNSLTFHVFFFYIGKKLVLIIFIVKIMSPDNIFSKLLKH